jgi:hypothetical protein
MNDTAPPAQVFFVRKLIQAAESAARNVAGERAMSKRIKTIIKPIRLSRSDHPKAYFLAFWKDHVVYRQPSSYSCSLTRGEEPLAQAPRIYVPARVRQRFRNGVFMRVEVQT